MTDTYAAPVATPAAASYVPPHDIEAERAVLASMLLGTEAVGRAIEGLTDSSVFYRDAHGKIYDAIVALYSRTEPADLITVTEELRKRGDLEMVGGPSGITNVFESATTAENIDAWVRVVAEKSLLRSLIRAARDIQQEAFAHHEEAQEILDRAEQRVFAVTDRRVRKTVTPIRDLLKPAFKHIEELASRSETVTGVASGYPDIDKLTSGFQGGELIIIGGRPSMGKSAFAVNIAENAAVRTKTQCAIFSLEMSEHQLIQRLLASQGGVALHRLRSGRLMKEDWPRLTTAAGLLSSAPIWIDDSPAPTVLEIRAKCRRLKAEHNLGLVLIDYLQMIRPAGRAENRVQEISQITRALKGLAKELNVPVIALSQLSRASEQRSGSDKRPQLSDLRESGSVEQDADVVMFVYREEYYKRDDPSVKGRATIIIAKQRNGPTGDIDMTFESEYTRFVQGYNLMPGETASDEPF
jgi:replicative DNA helicase